VRSFDEIGPENYRNYIDRKLPLGWLFVVPGEAGTDAAKEALASVAGSFKSKLSLVWVDASKYGSMAERVGLKAGQYPGFAVDFEDSHFVFPEGTPFTSSAFNSFLQDFVDGKLEQTVRSEPVPDPETKDGLTTVVGSRFDELVVKSDKDVLIEFYAPWCGHCKKLAPEYAKLAQQLSGVTTITIAQLDGTANDHNKKLFPVNGFPTIFFVSSATHQPVLYEGERTAAGMLAFIKQKASKPIPELPGADDEL
jgi:protein disulfide isomerase